jgi:hypothetical protein
MNTPYTVLESALEQDSVAIAHLGLATCTWCPARDASNA